MALLSSLTNPIRRLAYRQAEGSPLALCPVRVVPMTLQHPLFWHRLVQPLINDQYVKAAADVPQDAYAGVRADVGWNWPLNYALAGTSNRMRRGAERAVAWCIVADVAEGPIPIGMITAVPAYASPYPNDDAKRGFVWYLSNAPTEHYNKVGCPPLLRVAYMLVDIAIQTRLDVGADASIFLHADPAGGDKLTELYEGKCGMTRLRHFKRISAVREVTPGEYFAMENDPALAFCARFDESRGV
jgi:hypothetical protein